MFFTFNAACDTGFEQDTIGGQCKRLNTVCNVGTANTPVKFFGRVVDKSEGILSEECLDCSSLFKCLNCAYDY